jgi:putative oxidoreductase
MDSNLLILVARVCVSAVYLYSAFDKMIYWQNGLAFVARHRLTPHQPVLVATVAVQLAGGVMVLLGIWAREGATLLLPFTLIATIRVHFPAGLRGEEFRRETTISLEHLGIIGGLLMIAVTGPGDYALMPR